MDKWIDTLFFWWSTIYLAGSRFIRVADKSCEINRWPSKKQHYQLFIPSFLWDKRWAHTQTKDIINGITPKHNIHHTAHSVLDNPKHKSTNRAEIKWEPSGMHQIDCSAPFWTWHGVSDKGRGDGDGGGRSILDLASETVRVSMSFEIPMCAAARAVLIGCWLMLIEFDRVKK